MDFFGSITNEEIFGPDLLAYFSRPQRTLHED